MTSNDRTVPQVPGPWIERAACNPDNADLFYSDNPDDQEHAHRICRSCPVRAACDQHATTSNERAGIWAGRRRDSITRTPSANTHRNNQIHRLYHDGLTDEQIGDRVGLATATVKEHRQRLGLHRSIHNGRTVGVA